MGRVNEITADLLRRFAELRSERECVLSVYLDLDPSEFATGEARSSEIASVLDAARGQIETGERPHAELVSLRSDLGRIEDLPRSDSEWAQEAHAVAMFAAGPLGLLETIRLPVAVATETTVGFSPRLVPLAQIGPARPCCVALVDGRWARILRGTEHELREVVSLGDRVLARTQAGGWSQAGHQRHQGQQVQDHLRHTALLLRDCLRDEPFDLLLVGAPEERWSAIVEALHPDLRERLGERLSLDVTDASVAEVQEAASDAIEAWRALEQEERLQRLRDALGAGGRAAAGLTDVLAALSEQRVGTLLYEAGLRRPGARCPRCCWLGEPGPERCPVDGTPLLASDDVIEDAVQGAIRQSAEVIALAERPDLGPVGSVAALLRF